MIFVVDSTRAQISQLEDGSTSTVGKNDALVYGQSKQTSNMSKGKIDSDAGMRIRRKPRLGIHDVDALSFPSSMLARHVTTKTYTN